MSLCLLILAFSLTACANKEIVKEIIYKFPPESLMAHCDEPELAEFRTNSDVVSALLGYKEALDSCNADKAGLRVWAKELNDATK